MNSIKTILSMIESKAIDAGLKFRDQLGAKDQCKACEVMRSEFERWLGDVWLSDAEWDESKNTYSDSRIHCMWSAWQHQQTKVDELQKQKSLQELEINQIAQANQQWQLKCGELQKQRDSFIKAYDIEVGKSIKLQKRVDAAIRLLVQAELYQSEPNIDLAVQALKGD